MKKVSLAIEAAALTEATTALIQLFTDDFAEHSTPKGHIEMFAKAKIKIRMKRKSWRKTAGSSMRAALKQHAREGNKKWANDAEQFILAKLQKEEII